MFLSNDLSFFIRKFLSKMNRIMVAVLIIAMEYLQTQHDWDEGKMVCVFCFFYKSDTSQFKSNSNM